MASRIITKKGSGAPLASDLVHGELAVDTVNKRLYTENAGGTVIEVGTSPSTIDINAGTIDGTVIGGTTAAAITGTTITGTSFVSSGDMTFGDDDKAVFGAGSDLEIYHDGSNSYIRDAGQGNLRITSDSTVFIAKHNDENMIRAIPDAEVNLYYNGSEKLATTSTGIDVTGTVTADGLSVNGDLAFTGTSRTISAVANLDVDIDSDSNSAGAAFTVTANGGSNNVFKVVENGNISFYEDTGTTAKFFWDASAERLGIGTSSPTQLLDVASTGEAIAAIRSTGVGSARLVLTGSGGGSGFIVSNINNLDLRTATVSPVTISPNNTERMRIDSSGNLLVGTTTTVNPGVGNTITGFKAQFNGAIFASVDSNYAANFNRNGSDGTLVYFRNEGAIAGSVSLTGATTVSYNTSSDQRLKENITDAPAGNIDDIKVRSFDWKVDGSHQDYGMVAQELEAVAPYAVTKGETEDDMWSVDYSKLVPMLIKEIQDLKAEVAALKGAN